MASNGKLSFAVSISLLSEKFQSGANNVKNGLRNIQMQAMSMVAAMGVGSIGLSEFVNNLITTARETNRYTTALKNVSGGAEQFGKNQKFLIGISQKYGLYINDLVGNFSKFTAAASVANMSMTDQQNIFESLSRASTGFGLSADETNGVFVAVTQMMGKGKISAEELRGQLGERLPIAMQAMARAAGTSVAGLDKIMKKGELMSADVLPKFAKALNEMIPNISTDNVESSFNRLKNSFKELTDKLNVGDIYKGLLDQTNKIFSYIISNLNSVASTIVNIVVSVIIGKAINAIITGYKRMSMTALWAYKAQIKASGESFDKQAFNANKFGNVVRMTFAKVGLAIKSAFMSFAPMLIISGLFAIYQKFSSISEKQKEIKAIWTDYQKEIKNAGGTSDEIVKMQSLQRVMNNKFESHKNINSAQKELMGMLGLEKGNQSDINKAVMKRIQLLKESARVQLYSDTVVKGEKSIDDLSGSVGMSTTQIQRLVSSYIRNGVNKNGLGNKGSSQFQYDISKEFGGKGGYDLSGIIDVVKQVAVLNAVVKDANQHIDKSASNISNNSNTSGGNGNGGDSTDKETPLQKAEKEYKDNLIELNNQFKNKVILEKEYNKQLDELNKKTYEKIGGLLNPKEAEKNKTFGLAKNGVLNPLVKKSDIADEKYIEEKNKYNKELENLNKKREIYNLTDEQYNDELNNLIDSTINNIIAIDDVSDAAIKYSKELYKNKTKKVDKDEKEKSLKKYDYKSKYDSIGKSDIEIAEQNLEKAKKELDDLKEKALNTIDDLTSELDKSFSNVEGLDKALNLLKVKEQIKDLKKELSSGLYSGIKDIASSAQRLYESFKAVGETISDVDSSGWDKFISIWNALTNTVDSIMSVVNMISSLVEITDKLTKAKETETAITTLQTAATTTAAGVETSAIVAKGAAEIAVSKAVTSAYSGQMAAATAAAYAPLMLAGIPLATAQIAGYEAMILAASIPKFANGGIVGGSSYTGDKILARLNSGELVLNQNQQNKLLNGGSNGGMNQVEFKIEGKHLIGVINNYNKIKGKK